jgi:Flp pilus assembly protein TadG
MKRFIRRTAAKTTRLKKNESGAMALIAGLAAIPVFLAAGAAVDYGNWVAVDSRLQPPWTQQPLLQRAQATRQRSSASRSRPTTSIPTLASRRMPAPRRST